jgi:hypothetical protein
MKFYAPVSLNDKICPFRVYVETYWSYDTWHQSPMQTVNN